jgi:hypothetical protein|tara:strand:+ start:29 stop:499 length:471 start_codon:yes stop_codon:yes gene_type:complete
MADDPFTAVLKALWDILEANSEFSSLVSLGNRRKLWTGDTKIDKDSYSPADLPEVTIVPAGGTSNPVATSTGGNVIQIYRIQMLDGNLQASSSYFPLKWAIFKALASIDGLLSLSYVRGISVGDSVEERSFEDHPGWKLGIEIEVQMWWARTYLKA